MTSNIDFWNEGLFTFYPMCVVLLLFNKTLRGNCDKLTKNRIKFYPGMVHCDWWKDQGNWWKVTLKDTICMGEKC